MCSETPAAERDCLDEAGPLRLRLGEEMSPVLSVEPHRQAVGAFELMNANCVRRPPVVDGDRLVGIVTEPDLPHWVGAVAAVAAE